MPALETEVIIALIGLIGTLFVGGVGYFNLMIERHKTQQARQEIRFQRLALTFPEFIGEWEDTHKELRQLREETCIDRFIILRAWNGLLEPRWTTAVYQMRSDDQPPVSYVHFELDIDYINRLREISDGKGPPWAYYETESMPDSAIKDIYTAEKVTGSFWVHLDTVTIGDSKTGQAKAIAYCSFATHQEGGIDAVTQTRCRIIAGRLKGLAMSFDQNVISEPKE